mmetsp:Transcript_43948/g.94121  ORF Transcript_43948/g.94121 Transcript_43948/m.94121 type:complete len:406 (-) Transcript_43948:447-1664(-)
MNLPENAAVDGAAPPDAETCSTMSGSRECGNLIIDHCFRYLANVLLDGDFIVEQEVDGVSVSFMEVECSGTCWARLSAPNYEIDYDDKVLTAYPEINAMYRISAVLNTELVELISPGDAMIRLNFSSKEVSMQVSALIGSLREKCRWSLRKDFPRQGVSSMVLAPPDTGGMQPFGNLTLLCHFLTIVKNPNRPGFVISHYLQLPWAKFPSWATASLLQVAQIETFRHSAGDAIFEDIRNHYVVLSLKSRAGGHPLLPLPLDARAKGRKVNAGGYSWISSGEDRDNFNFSNYLSAFFEAMGHRVPVWESMGGRFLVPYQVVVAGSDWRRLSEQFQGLCRSHRTAYRRMYSQASAPKIKESNKPHYTDLWTTEVPNYVHEVIVERNTFLTMSKARRPSKAQRSAEYP